MRASGRSTARWRAGGADGRGLPAWALALAALAGLGGCGRSAPVGAPGAADAGAFDANEGDVVELEAGGPDGGACTVIVAQHPDEGALHVDCLPIPTYHTKPPSSGNHYPIWADFKTYATPVPWGHLVHDLEHGAIVIVYNCPGGCPDEVAAAQAMIDAFPADPICASPPTHRLILAPDPTLDVRWAASAWTWTLRATCFDTATFRDFAAAHYGMGRELLCEELHEPFCDVP